MLPSGSLSGRGPGRAVCLVLAAVAWVSSPPATRAEPTGPVSQWLTSDTVIYAEFPRPAALLERVKDKRLTALATSVPGLKKAFESDDVRKLRDVAALVADRLGKPWDEAFAALTGGGAVLAVEARPGRPPGTVLVVTPTDPALLKKAIDVLIELARKDAADNGRDDPVKSAEYRGVTGYAAGKGAYAVVSDRLVVADRPEVLKAAIDRMQDGIGKAPPIESDAAWKARRDAARTRPDTLAWGYARLDRLRELDAKKFSVPVKPNAGATIFFGGWLDVLRKAPWVGAEVAWNASALAADLTMPAPADARGGPFKGYVPPAGSGAPKLVKVPGTILSTSLWRDLAALWEARADLLKPEEVQNLAQLDGFAGQFFGGRDFGTGVLGATTPAWRLVVANQDPKTLTPEPDVKLPAFALVFDLKPGDDDFAQRLKVAFQSFVGLANIGAAQQKAPPLELLSESFEGVTIATTRYMPPPPDSKAKANGKEGEKPAVATRHNFSPSAVQVGRHFVLGSSLGLTRDLVKSLKTADGGPDSPEDGTLVAEADGEALAKLIGLNRQRLVMQNILEKGNDQEQAEGEVDLLAALVKYLRHGRLSIKDGSDQWRASLKFDLQR